MACVLLCLRGNLSLSGDAALADRELRALLPEAELARGPLAAAWPAFAHAAAAEGDAPPDPPLATGESAYVTDLTAARLGTLLARATFLQQVYALPSAAEAASFAALTAEMPFLRRAGAPLFRALTAQCATELASLVAASAPTPERVGGLFAAACAALLGDGTDERERARAAALARRPRASAYLTHDLHVYKAKFFPRLARAALNLVLPASAGGLLLDPFAGSGTALLEAARLGVPSLGADLDPLSVLIARCKLLLPLLNAAALRAPLAGGAFDASAVAPAPRVAGTGARAPFALPPWLARKLTPEEISVLLAETQALTQAIAALPAGPVRTVARVCLSDALTRKLRLRFLGTGVGRFALQLSRLTVRGLFLRRYAAVCREAALYAEVLALGGPGLGVSAAAICADARVLPLASGSATAALTSPPYLPASSGRENYARSKAASLLALGLLDALGVDALDRDATGSMAASVPGVHAAGLPPLLPEERRLVDWLAADPLRSIKAEPSRRYFLDLRRALRELGRVLAPGARAAVVVGTRSTFYRYATREPVYTVETAALLADVAAALGFTVDELIEVELDKGNRNARPRSLDAYSETILLLRNG